MYAPLYFPIPTPVGPQTGEAIAFDAAEEPQTLGDFGMSPHQSGADYSPWRGDPGAGIPYDPSPNFPGRPHVIVPLNPVRPTRSPIVPDDTNPIFVAQGNDKWLNINTGEIVDGETKDLVSAAAATDPRMLALTVAQLPANLVSPAMEGALKSTSVQTAASVGVGPGAATGIMGWLQAKTSIGGMLIPNWAFPAVGGGLLLLAGGRKGRR
jgi:hypothetical protein